MDTVSCAEKTPLPGLANGAFYGPGIVLDLRGDVYQRGGDRTAAKNPSDYSRAPFCRIPPSPPLRIAMLRKLPVRLDRSGPEKPEIFQDYFKKIPGQRTE